AAATRGVHAGSARGGRGGRFRPPPASPPQARPLSLHRPPRGGGGSPPRTPGGGAVPASTHTILASFGPAFLRQHDGLLRARQTSHRIREGHGDLRAEHVCVVETPVEAGPPHAPLAPGMYVIDCVEFSHALRCNDVASEVAFLA